MFLASACANVTDAPSGWRSPGVSTYRAGFVLLAVGATTTPLLGLVAISQGECRGDACQRDEWVVPALAVGAGALFLAPPTLAAGALLTHRESARAARSGAGWFSLGFYGVGTAVAFAAPAVFPLVYVCSVGLAIAQQVDNRAAWRSSVSVVASTRGLRLVGTF